MDVSGLPLWKSMQGIIRLIQTPNVMQRHAPSIFRESLVYRKTQRPSNPMSECHRWRVLVATFFVLPFTFAFFGVRLYMKGWVIHLFWWDDCSFAKIMKRSGRG